MNRRTFLQALAALGVAPVVASAIPLGEVTPPKLPPIAQTVDPLKPQITASDASYARLITNQPWFDANYWISDLTITNDFRERHTEPNLKEYELTGIQYIEVGGILLCDVPPFDCKVYGLRFKSEEATFNNPGYFNSMMRSIDQHGSMRLELNIRIELEGYGL